MFPTVDFFRTKAYRGFLAFCWGFGTLLLLVPQPEYWFEVTHVAPVTSRIQAQHVVLFATLTFLTDLARVRMSWWLCAIAICVYGLAIEFIQPFTGRTFSLYDARDNVIGVAIGLTLAVIFRHIFIRRQNKSRNGAGTPAQ